MAAVAASPTAVRMAVPDIAGMLYPQPAREMTFPSWQSDLPPFYAIQLAAGDELPPCDETLAALCLDVVWTSAFEWDPFFLVALESQHSVASATFDGQNAAIRPIVAGDESNLAANATNSSNQPRTLWRFHAPRAAEAAAAEAPPPFELLFRLRQQSQFRAARDQLVVHLTISRDETHAARTALEAYAVYGNQRVAHAVAFAGAAHIRVDLSISRSVNEPDVVLQDAYPLVPVVFAPTSNSSQAWRLTDPTCLRCYELLLGCATREDLNNGVCSFASTAAPLPLCLATSFGLTNDWFKTKMAGAIGETTAITSFVAMCFANMMSQEAGMAISRNDDRQWWNATRALSCLAAHQCPFGPLREVAPATSLVPKTIELTDPTPFVYRLQWRQADGISGHFVLTFGASMAGSDFAVGLTTDSIFAISTDVHVARVLQAALASFGSVSVTATMAFVGTDVFCDIFVSHLVFPDFGVAFEPSADATWEFSPLGAVGGAVSVRVAPLNATQFQVEYACDACAEELEACRLDEACRLMVLPCVARAFAALEPTNATVDVEYGSYRIDLIGNLGTSCFENAPTGSWDPIRRALVCVSRHSCSADAINSTDVDEHTFVRLEEGSQVVAVPLIERPDNSSAIALQISYQTSTFSYYAPVDQLAMFVRMFVLENAADVTVASSTYVANSRMIQLHITYANALTSTNPSFAESDGLIAIHDSAPKAFVEFADPSVFSVEKMLQVLRSFLTVKATAGDLTAATNHTWDLAPECTACSARLLGCEPAEVSRRVCLYDNATSPLAQCIRQIIPRQAIATLVDALPGHETTKTIATEVTRCIQTASSLAGDAATTRIAASSAVSCFAATRCPFGPVDLVRSDRMVQLVSSSYLQSLRIASISFRVDLVFVIGKVEVAHATITSDASVRSVLGESLEPLGITVAVESAFQDGEWTLGISYLSVVSSDFAVRLAPSSTPSPTQIGQAILRPTTRLVVLPRLDSKVSRPSSTIDDDGSSGSGTSSTSSDVEWSEEEAGYPGTGGSSSISDNNSTGTSSNQSDAATSGSDGSSAYSAADPSDLLTFSSACAECDSSHLAACGRSQFCRTVLATCVSSYLKQHSFAAVAQTLPDGTTTVDLAPMVRACVPSEAFYDWWDGMQRWLGCYAAHRCPTSRPDQRRQSDSYIEFFPAAIKASTTVPYLWDGAQGEIRVIVPSGSAMAGRHVVAASNVDLQAKLQYASQGTSTVTVITEADGPNQETSIRVEYEGPFLGPLPTFDVGDGIVSGQSSNEARLVLRSTTPSFEAEPWGTLSDKLSAMLATPPTTPPTCAECASTYLQQCRDLPTCRGYLVECLSHSLEHDYVDILEAGTDREVFPVLQGCAKTLSVAEWWPLQNYFACTRDLQCLANDATNGSGTASYLRLSSGGLRVLFDPQTNEVGDVTISSDQNSPYVQSLGELSIEALQIVLQDHIGATGRVELVVHMSSSQAEFIFRDYIGTIPWVVVGPDPATSWTPSVIFYSSGQTGTLAFSTALANYTVAPQCTAICYDHLEDCTRGDSFNSLRCRYQILPCVSNILTNDLSSGGADDTQVEFSSNLRYCSPQNYAPLKSIAHYFGCLARSGCTLNEPRSTEPRVQLVLQPGEQELQIAGNKLVGFNTPAGFATSEYLQLNASALEHFVWTLRHSVLQSLAVVSTTVDLNGPDKLPILYNDYIGNLPVVSGDGVTVLKETLPSITVTSSHAIANSRITRLETAINAFKSDDSASCASCISDYLPSCPVCVSTVLPSLLTMLYQPTNGASTTLNMTSAFYTVVDTLPETEWIPVARMLNCYMLKGCAVSEGSYASARPPTSSTSFMMVQPAALTLEVDSDSGATPKAVYAAGHAPSHSLDGSVSSATTIELTVDSANHYQLFKQGLLSLLPLSGQSPVLIVTERDPAVANASTLHLDIEIRDYFGWLPTVVSSTAPTPGVVPASPRLPTLIAQTYGDEVGASVQGLVTLLEAYTPAPAPAARVPTGYCAQCASDLYECDLNAVASGICTYTTATATFSTCLRRQLPPSVFYGVGRSLGASYVVNDALASCFGLLQEQDQAVGASSFQNDTWYQKNQQLACYERYGCAFGPFDEGLAGGNMVQLLATNATSTFQISTDPFEAAFRSTFGFRTLTTGSFTQSTTDVDLTALVSSILPAADVTATITATTGPPVIYEVTVTSRYIYFPDFTLSLDESSAPEMQQTASTIGLKTVPVDNAYIDNAA